jgi:hypothetical protein
MNRLVVGDAHFCRETIVHSKSSINHQKDQSETALAVSRPLFLLLNAQHPPALRWDVPHKEARLERGSRAEDELGLELAKSIVSDLGVDEAESAKSLSIGEGNDVSVKLGRERREEHGAGKER